MGTLVKQECFKLFKKKSTYILPIIIIIIMLALAILGNHYSDVFNLKESFKGGFSSFSWVVFLMIIQASTIISMEFHYGTIKNLLYRNYSRTSIIVSKFITLFIYSLIIFLFFIIISLLLHLIFNGETSLTEHSKNHISLLNSMLLTALGTFVGMWLVMSLTLLISCIMKSPGVSIAVGIVFYFAASIISGLLTAVIDKWEWLKWNPLNMMNIMAQITDNDTFKKITKLELHELFIGNIIYIVIFLVLVVVAFKKKNV